MRALLLVLAVFILSGCPTPATTGAKAPSMPPSLVTGEPELVVATGHTDSISDIAFSPDSQLMATASRDGTVRLWDMRLQRELRTFRGHRNGVGSVTFSPDGNRLATGGPDGVVRLWSVDDGTMLREMTGHEKMVHEVVFTPDGKHLLSEDLDLLAIWSVETGQPVGTVLNVLDFLPFPDGTSVLVNRDDGTMAEVAVPSGKVKRSLTLKNVRPHAIDGDRLLGVHRKAGEVGWWSLRTGEQLETLSFDKGDTRDGKMADPMLRPSDGTLLLRFDDRLLVRPGESSSRTLVGASRVASFSPDGRWLATRGPDPMIVRAGERYPYDIDYRTIRLYDAETFERVIDLDPVIPAANPRHLGLFNSFHVAFHPTEPILATGSIDGKVRLWDLRRAGPPLVLAGHRGPIIALEFNPRGNRLASGDPKETIVWDVKRGALRRRLALPGRSFEFDRSGNLLLVGGLEGHVSQVSVLDGRVLRRERVHDAGGFSLKDVAGIELSTDETHMWTAGSDQTVAYWKVGDDGIELEWREKGHEEWIYDLALNPADDSIAISGGQYAGMSQFKGGYGKNDYIQLFHRERGAARLKGHEENVTSLDFSPDGRMLASGSIDQTVKLWDMSSGKELGSLGGHSSSVTSVSFASDNRMLATASAGGEVRLWDTITQKPIAILMATSEGGYVMATPDRYYTASRDGLRAVGFRFGRRVAPFELFDLQRNRPDIVLERLGYADEETLTTYRRAHQRRLKKMKLAGASTGADMAQLPVVSLAKTPPLATEAREVNLDVVAGDPGGDLDRLMILVNDVPIFGTAGLDLTAGDRSVQRVPVSFGLSKGRNEVQISALNAAGLESFQETFVTTYRGRTEPPTLHVLTVGVSRYAEPSLDLQYPAKDAADIADLFQRKGDARFSKVRVMRVLDREVTRKNVNGAKKFLAQTKIDDQVVLFIAGHGLLTPEGDYYFVASNVDPQDPTKTGIPWDELEGLLDGIPARRKLMLVDTCHSGEVEDPDQLQAGAAATRLPGTEGKTDGVKRGKTFRALELWQMPVVRKRTQHDGALTELFADLRRGTGAMVIASSTGTEYAWEDDRWKNGAFTFSVLEGLETAAADLDGSGTVTVTELRDYVTLRVQELTGGEQHPTTRRENLTDDFPVF